MGDSSTRTTKTLSCEELAEWIRGSVEEWQKVVQCDARLATKPYDADAEFTCTLTFQNLRLMRLIDGSGPVSLLLYQLEADRDHPVVLRYVATKPGCRRVGYASILFREFLRQVQDRPIGATDVSIEGRAWALGMGFERSSDVVFPLRYNLR